MDEDVRSSVAAGNEAETAQAIEPLDDDALESRRRCHRDMRTRRRHLRRMDRGTLIHRENAKGLSPLGAVQHFADHACTFIGGLETVPAQARHVQQDIGGTIVRDDKTEALRHVEPFYGA